MSKSVNGTQVGREERKNIGIRKRRNSASHEDRELEQSNIQERQKWCLGMKSAQLLYKPAYSIT
jgi:hypothetical protein